MKSKSRRIRTLSSNVSNTTGTASKKAPVPSPAPPTKSKRSFEIITEPEDPTDTIEIQNISYDAKKIVKKFEEYSEEYFKLVTDQVLRHQALRTAITQVGSMTAKEFNNAVIVLDVDMDEAIAELFKLNFLTTIIDNLNEAFHEDAPLPNMGVFQMLFAPQTPPVAPAKSPGFDSKKLVEQLKRMMDAQNPQSPFGINQNDKTNT